MHPLLLCVALTIVMTINELLGFAIRKIASALYDLEEAVYGLRSTKWTQVKVWVRIVCHAVFALVCLGALFISTIVVIEKNGLGLAIISYMIVFFTWKKIEKWYVAEKASAQQTE